MIVLQPDFGQTLLIGLSWLILIFVSGINLFFLFIIFNWYNFFIIYCFFIPKFEYIKNRLLSFFDRETGTHNFQSDKALDSIISGGFFGKGIGEGTLKIEYQRHIQIILFQLFLKNLV